MNTIKKQYKKWTPEEDKWLIENYLTFGAKKCAEHLGVPNYGVMNRCRKLKLNKININTWTDEEISLLKRYYPTGGSLECEKHINKNRPSINDKARRMGIKPPNQWTPEEEEVLKLHYFERGAKFCANIINRTRSSIVCYAKKMGLKTKRNSLKISETERLCSKCNIIKSLEEFSMDKNKPRSICLICDAEKSRKYQKLNKEKVYEKNKRWAEKNKERIKEYRQKNLPKTRELRKQRYHSDAEFRERIIKNVKKYRNNPKNKPTIRATQERLRKEYAKDPAWRAMMNLRRRLGFILSGQRSREHSLALIGCDLETLKKHLEAQFKDGMNWDNYGVHGWHVDHIRCCASFDLTQPEQQRQCFHYTNLQPLWAADNLSKGAG